MFADRRVRFPCRFPSEHLAAMTAIIGNTCVAAAPIMTDYTDRGLRAKIQGSGEATSLTNGKRCASEAQGLHIGLG